MKYLGYFATADDVRKLIAHDGLEFIDAWLKMNSADQVLRFVRYEAGARSGKFHHYVSLEMPIAEFHKLELVP